ncbi:MAG: molybdenum cofactor biosynthesis protein MoaB [Rhodothermales bacterium]|nr:molybdenum cofactor biosynthesis protein MoaB [Rhodothermales bacterium]MBO6780710.1 molybdenum cofactor biosynthesis protein MoaB [Rhodothermales bacterium]
MSTVPDAHRQAAGAAGLPCAIITCSDTRSEVDDRSGPIMKSLLELAGHEIVSYEVVREDPALIRSALERAAARARIVLLNGGTGVSPRDNTVDVVRAFVERDLPGFGELFRTLSYQEIGAAAMLSRAVAGTRGATAVFATPGSSAAVTLAMEKLILPEIRHLASLLDG